MKFLAIDYGTKRIGVAVSDDLGMLARPLPFVDATVEKKLLSELQELIQREKIEQILIGLPRNMDGSYGESATKVREFVEKLKTITTLPIKTVDERLSTVQASRQLHEAGHRAKEQRGKIDSVAAAILLQGYLDFQSLLPPPDEE